MTNAEAQETAVSVIFTAVASLVSVGVLLFVVLATWSVFVVVQRDTQAAVSSATPRQHFTCSEGSTDCCAEYYKWLTPKPTQIQ